MACTFSSCHSPTNLHKKQLVSYQRYLCSKHKGFSVWISCKVVQLRSNSDLSSKGVWWSVLTKVDGPLVQLCLMPIFTNFQLSATPGTCAHFFCQSSLLKCDESLLIYLLFKAGFSQLNFSCFNNFSTCWKNLWILCCSKLHCIGVPITITQSMWNFS